MLFCSDLSEKKRAFLTGTLLLTAARLSLPPPGLFLPYFSFPYHRSRGARHLQYGTSGLRHLLCPLRRVHPDRPFPVHSCPRKPGPKSLSHRPYYLHGALRHSRLSDLPVSGLDCLPYSHRTALCAVSSDHGAFPALCFISRLCQRLLLRCPKIPGSRIFPGWPSRSSA